jgi:hypothetical protein
MRNLLFIVLVLMTQLALANGRKDRAISIEQLTQDSTTWLFKEITKDKEILMSKGDRAKIRTYRNTTKVRGVYTGYLVDINESYVILADRKNNQTKIKKLERIRKISVSSKEAQLSISASGDIWLAISSGFIFLAFTIRYSGLMFSYSAVFVPGLLGVIFALVGAIYLYKGKPEIINKPFSDKWEILKVDHQVEDIPSIQNP